MSEALVKAIYHDFGEDSQSQPLRGEPFVSVVVPVFNEEEVIRETCTRLTGLFDRLGLRFEIICVDDGSTDNTMLRLHEQASLRSEIKVIELSRNFGHQIAVSAGIDNAKGDVVVLIDADLQDPPELICEFLDKWHEGYDVVYAVRQSRQGETWFKKTTAGAFYRFLRRATDVPIPLDTGDFRLMSRSVVDSLLAMPEKHRFIRGMVSWVGYKQIGIPYVRQQRFAGETKYPLKKMIRFAVDGVTSFSHVPLKWATKLGFIVSGFAFVTMVLILMEKLFTDLTIQGWTSLMVVSLFLGGIQLIMIGIVGEYIGRIYDEVRQRPLYLIRNKYNFGRDE